MRPASKQRAIFKEPIRERGVLPLVRTISRDEIGPPQKIMTLQFGGSMVKNNPENARARAEETELSADTRHFPGQLPGSLSAYAAGAGASAGASVGAKSAPRRAPETAPRLHEIDAAARKAGRVDFSDAVGRELQTLYEDLVAQPVPDRFLSLLNQLEKNVVSSGLSSSAPGERE